jgi:hypothetical protein
MRCVLCIFAALGFILVAAVERAAASVLVDVDRSNQTMFVTVDGEQRYACRARRLHHAAGHVPSADAGGTLVLARI